MFKEVPLRPHHLYHVAMEIAGWNDPSMADALVHRVNRYTQPDQIVTHNKYYRDLIGRDPDRPTSMGVFSGGLEKAWFDRNKAAMSTYLNLDNRDHVRLISSGKDLICNACYFGEHCIETGSEDYERERIFSINAKLNSLSIGQLDIFNPEDSLKCFAVVTAGILRTLIDMAIIWSKDLEHGVIRGRETTLRSFLYNDPLYV